MTRRTFSTARDEIANRESLPSKKRTAGDEHFGCFGRDSKHEAFMKKKYFLDSRDLTEVHHWKLKQEMW